MINNGYHPIINRQNSGKGLLTFLIAVVVLAILGYVAWVTYRSWQRSGEFKPTAVLNADERQAAHDDARPHLDRAIELGADALEALNRLSAETFGSGGYIDQASAWMKSDNSSPIQEALEEEPSAPASPVPPAGNDATTAPPAAPAAPSKSAETQRLEQTILSAEQDFQKALSNYQTANPANGGWTAERRNAVKQAHQGFSAVRDRLSSGGSNDLYDRIEQYARQPDHNPTVLRRAREMAGHNQRLLTNARRMSSAL